MQKSDWFAAFLCALGAAATFLLGGPIWGCVFLVIAAVSFAMFLRSRAVPESLLWTEIEARLKELRLRDINRAERSDGPLDLTQDQTREGGFVWRLSGSTKSIRSEADVLFRIAGQKLLESDIASQFTRLQREMTDNDRWLWFLVEVGGHTKHVTASGTNQPTTHTYWIRQVLDHAVAACAECIARENTRVH